MIIGMACCSTSCMADHDSDAPDTDKKEEIRFEVENSTRASVTYDSNINNSFMVFGEMYTPDGHVTMFDKDEVKHDENGNWDYFTPQYWLMGEEHSFAAIHPYKVDGMSDINYSAEDSKVSFTYTLPKNNDGTLDYKDATDIIIATHRRKYNFDTQGPVKLKFKHILTRINIMPALKEVLMYEDEQDKKNRPYNKGEFIVFDKIDIHAKLKTKADFIFQPAGLPEDLFQTDVFDMTCKLDDSSVVEDAVLTFKDSPKVTNNGAHVNICDDDNALILLPQSVEKATLTLFYRVNDDTPTIRKIIIELTNPSWEGGKSYTYKFIIDKAYTGQISEGSLEIEADDFRLPDNNDNEWIDGGETISYDFSEDGTTINGEHI